MPRYKIECTAQVRRIYEVDAATPELAKAYVSENGADCLVHEEDTNEEVRDVSVIKEKTFSEVYDENARRRRQYDE